MNRIAYLLLAMLLMVCTLCPAYAQEVAPCADVVFTDIYINLTSRKSAIYTAVTYYTYEEIKVTSSYLEKIVDGEWVTIANLTVPGSGVDTFSFTTSTDCSDLISSGTYRVVATFYADGYTATRVSNERTY